MWSQCFLSEWTLISTLLCTSLFQQIVVSVDDIEFPRVPVPNSVAEGETVRLSCEPRELMKKITEVRHRDLEILAYAWISESGAVLSTQKELVINGASATDSGKYTCSILALEGGRHVTYQQSFNLRVDSSYSRSMRSFQEYEMEIVSVSPVEEGEPFTLRCIVKPSLDYANYKWSRLGANGSVKDGLLGTSQDLTLPSFVSTDSSLYRCQVVGYQQNPGRTVNLKADIDPKNLLPMTLKAFKATIFEIRIDTKPEEGIINEPMTLTCTVKPALRNMVYEWYRGGRLISRERILTIDRLEAQDAVTYMCRARGLSINDMELRLEGLRNVMPKQYVRQTVVLEPPPGLIVSDYVGSRKELHCELHGEFGGTVQWFFQDRLLDSALEKQLSAQKITDRRQVSILVLKSLALANTGIYQCRTPRGVQEVTVNVMERVRLLEINPPVQIIYVGEVAEIHCLPQGYSNLRAHNVKWFYMGQKQDIQQPLNSRWQRIDNLGESNAAFIELTNAQLEDTGYYMCQTPSMDERVSQLIVLSKAEIKVRVTPKTVTVRIGVRVEVDCFSQRDKEAYGKPMWYLENGEPVQIQDGYQVQQITEGHSRLIIRNGLAASENGMKVVCRLENATDTAVIQVQDLCPINFRRCRDGRCVSSSKFCDGVRDCLDGSDEDPIYCQACDPLEKLCMVHNNLSPTTKTYLAHWSCDGEDDCGNGYDEANCPVRGTQCGGTHFACTSSSLTIPRAFQCDKEGDCPNREDEQACQSPTFVNMGVGRREYRARENVTIQCDIRGSPLPRVIWRFNWGCLPDQKDESRRAETRFTVHTFSQGCEHTISTLTISNFNAGDDGIYNCEALSGNERIMSPDFLLILGQG